MQDIRNLEHRASSKSGGAGSGGGVGGGTRQSQLTGGMGAVRNRFDFSSMDEFAAKERRSLNDYMGVKRGLPRWDSDGGYLRETEEKLDRSPVFKNSSFSVPDGVTLTDTMDPSSQDRYSSPLANPISTVPEGDLLGPATDHATGAESSDQAPAALEDESTPSAPPTAIHRRRQRKSSNSTPQPSSTRRQGRLALFEGIGGAFTAGDTSTGASASGGASNGAGDESRDGLGGLRGLTSALPTKAARHKNSLFGGASGGGGAVDSKGNHVSATYADYPEHLGTRSGSGLVGPSQSVGPERPYRFSFYSNALPATIHARSLSELPAEGQSFEDLFNGRGGFAPQRVTTNDKIGLDTSDTASNQSSPLVNAGDFTGSAPNPKISMVAKATKSANARATGRSPSPPPPSKDFDDDPESKTWWLDVLSPTDEEMRMLAKVFGIHPLTTEDILLEETREKIELLRNYYLVCFRSFDQDPYSQTYLEPLNMYIIVFREGTLSVSLLFARVLLRTRSTELSFFLPLIVSL